MRASIEDGSIADLVQWREVVNDDVIFVPAGTIHAIGAGLVIAEIQQSSDATFRLFDFGRQRELHVDYSVAASNAGPAERQSASKRLTDSRTLLVASPHFVLERIDLAQGSNWTLHAVRETWVLVLDGRARFGALNTFVGEAVFLEADSANLKVGPTGLKGLVAYLGPDWNPGLLENIDERDDGSPKRGFDRPSLHDAKPPSSLIGSMEARA